MIRIQAWLMKAAETLKTDLIKQWLEICHESHKWRITLRQEGVDHAVALLPTCYPELVFRCRRQI
jgi:hypothetical protein